MRTTLFALALAGAVTATSPDATAGTKSNFKDCHVRSDYDMRIQAQSLSFKHRDDAQHHVEIAAGDLWFNGSRQTLDANDRDRLMQFEASARALVEEAREVGLDAVDLALEALAQVHQTLLDRPIDASRRADIDRLANLARDRIRNAQTVDDFKDAEFEAELERAAKALLPSLAAELAASAMTAALSGNEQAARDLERRARQLEVEIKQTIEQRAREIEMRAATLCPSLYEMEQVLASLDWRAADGSELRLIKVKR